LASLYFLDADGFLAKDFRILATARTALDRAGFLAQARAVLDERLEPVDEAIWTRFAARIAYVAADLAKPGGATPLAEALGDAERPLFFLAISPSLYIPVVQALGAAGLARPGARIILEKPIGRDLATSREINDALGAAFDESRTFRIDHYLGKETVQNILTFRFSNGIWERLWNRECIDHVQITVAEKLGVGSRGGYYEEAGAIRDMVQNHVLQVLSLVGMEPPSSLGAENVRDEKVKLLKSIRPMTPSQVAENVVRGQYFAGEVDGEARPAYRSETKVKPNSHVETFLAMRLFVDNWRWHGVPFYIRTGKNLPLSASEVRIQFKSAPNILFAAKDQIDSNSLTLRLQPNEGMTLRFNGKVPGGAAELRPVRMHFSYDTEFGAYTPEAY
ncbi:MAG: glucose-6-phosphate dehydrogenase, partial [Verrucomicrobiota bacterium]